MCKNLTKIWQAVQPGLSSHRFHFLKDRDFTFSICSPASQVIFMPFLNLLILRLHFFNSTFKRVQL